MKNAIDTARRYMKCRKFADAISTLNAKRSSYEESFDFSYTLGLAFLYAGDTGSAAANFENARKIRLNDANLLLAQAVIFLRRGDTDRAVQYYLDILDLEPDNKNAKRALEFIRTHGDYEEICRWVDDGRIEHYYPPLGVNPLKVRNCVLALLCGAVFGAAAVFFWPKNYFKSTARADLSALMLTSSERQALSDGGNSASLNLSSAEINASYNKVAEYVQTYRDNAAQHEVNRILNSNASAAVKEKCRLITKYFEPPVFDTLKDNFSYEEVAENPLLYIDCYVDWSGRAANIVPGDNSLSCDLLVGYEDGKNLLGTIPLRFDFLPHPEINAEKSVRVLGRLSSENGKVFLNVSSVYQSVKDF